MKRNRKYKTNSLAFATMFCMLSLGMCNIGNTEANFPSFNPNSEEGSVTLTSNSFTTKKKSDFNINGIKEQIKRGLTIIHFTSSKKYEFRTFDTHGSSTETVSFMDVLKTLQENKAKYAVLAHDSASKELQKFSVPLMKLGFEVLSSLKSRQAYVMHNLNGRMVDKQARLSVSLDLEIPKSISDKKIYFPKAASYEFEPSVDRYIAHAGGEVNGTASTNTRDALDQNYKKGFRVFELDIIETSDGKLVAAHDWGMWSRFTSYKGALPVSHAEFMKRKIYGKYTTMDMDGINKWFGEHPDATLITDKINDPIRFAGEFLHKDRLIMELFSLMAIEEASSNGIKAMISQKPLRKVIGNKAEYLAINNIKYVAISRRTIARNAALLNQLRKDGVKVYVYHVNFDDGKDEKYVLENEIGQVYGMYADKWVFDNAKPPKTMAK